MNSLGGIRVTKYLLIIFFYSFFLLGKENAYFIAEIMKILEN